MAKAAPRNVATLYSYIQRLVVDKSISLDSIPDALVFSQGVFDATMHSLAVDKNTCAQAIGQVLNQLKGNAKHGIWFVEPLVMLWWFAALPVKYLAAALCLVMPLAPVRVA